MPLDEKARYTMRIDRDLLEKFGYIAESVSYTHLTLPTKLEV